MARISTLALSIVLPFKLLRGNRYPELNGFNNSRSVAGIVEIGKRHQKNCFHTAWRQRRYDNFGNSWH